MPSKIKINASSLNELNNEDDILNQKYKTFKIINNKNSRNNFNRNNSTKLKYNKDIVKKILEQNKHYTKINIENNTNFIKNFNLKKSISHNIKKNRQKNSSKSFTEYKRYTFFILI